MLKSKLLIWTFVFITLVFLVTAQDEEEFDPNKFDFENGDYSKVDWNLISFVHANSINKGLGNPTLNFDDIPEWIAPGIDVTKAISKGRGKELTSEIIAANFNEIEDLNDLDENEAKQAIREKFYVNVNSFGKGSQITDRILISKTGEKDILPLDGLSKDASVWVDDKGRIFVASTTLPDKGQYTASYNYVSIADITSSTRQYEHREIQLPNGQKITLSGRLSIKDEKTYVRRGEVAIINDFVIHSGYNNDIQIYFEDGNHKGENYVTFYQDNNIDVGTSSSGYINLIPYSGNKLFNMVKKKYQKDKNGILNSNDFTLIPDSDARLSINIDRGDELQIRLREDEGKTPKIIHRSNGDGRILVVNGRMFAVISEGRLTMDPPQYSSSPDFTNSVPFELVSNGFDGTLRISSSNRYALINNEGKEIAGSDLGLDISNKIEVNMMKDIDDLKVKYPAMSFHTDDKVTSNLVQALDQWLKDKEGAEQYIDGFLLNTKETRQIGSFQRIGTIGLAEDHLDPGYFAISEIRDQDPLDVIDHEFIHVLNHNIDDREPSVIFPGVSNIPLQTLYDEYIESLIENIVETKQYKSIVSKTEALANQEVYNEDSPFEFSIEIEDIIVQMLDQMDFEQWQIQASNLYKERNRLDKLIQEKTGLYTYSFREYSNGYAESSTTYNELPANSPRAKMHPYLAQLEYDTIYSLDPPAPKWMKDKADERYYTIMGDRCKTEPCGPCLAYKLTCNP